MKPDNLNAFPTPESEHNYAVEGMSLRDYFAGQALAGMLANRNVGGDVKGEEIAMNAYRAADHMLAEREKES